MPTILNLKITAEHQKRVWSNAGAKLVDKDGTEHESIDDFALLKVTYNQLKQTMISIYDSLSQTWAKSPANRHNTKLPAFNQITVQYAQCIEDCWKACWDCGQMGQGGQVARTRIEIAAPI